MRKLPQYNSTITLTNKKEYDRYSIIPKLFITAMEDVFKNMNWSDKEIKPL